ncbi:24735_t:CDS:2 [Gigaspora rosea]|nr:24735_t:CDS:2 [Gigaspora rosea]
MEEKMIITGAKVSLTLKSVPPDTYDVVWRLKIDDSSDLQRLNFSTIIIERLENEINIDHEQNYNHIPQPTTKAEANEFYFLQCFDYLSNLIISNSFESGAKQFDEACDSSFV